MQQNGWRFWLHLKEVSGRESKSDRLKRNCVLMSQPEKKSSEGTTVAMPVHHIIVSPITGLLETHTVTIKDENQVSN